MGKFDEVIEKSKKHIDKHFAGHNTDEDLLRKVAKGLGPSIYGKDSSTVSCSSSKERDTIREKFLVKKHGIEDAGKADTAIEEVCQQYKGARDKLRPVFYYVLVKKLGLEKNYA